MSAAGDVWLPLKLFNYVPRGFRVADRDSFAVVGTDMTKTS